MNFGILAITILLTTLWGWHTGVLRLVVRLGVLLLAYGLAWQETPDLVNLLAEKGWLTGVLAWPAAAGTLFIGGSLLFSALGSGFLYVAPDEWKSRGKLSGGLAGCALGAVAGLMLVWSAGVVQDAIHARQQLAQRQDGGTSPQATHPDRSPVDQAIHDLANNALAGTVSAIMPDTPAATFTREMLKSPLSVGQGFRSLAEHPALRELLANQVSYSTLLAGNPAQIRQLPAFQALVTDPEVMSFLTAAGLSGETPAAREADLADKLSSYARNFEVIRHTPAFQSLVQDPQFRERLKAGDWLSLLNDDKVRQLAEMLINPPDDLQARLEALPPPATGFSFSAPGDTQWTSSSANLAGTAQPVEPTAPAAPRTIYRWKDANGRLHLTDEKPPEGIPFDTMVQ